MSFHNQPKTAERVKKEWQAISDGLREGVKTALFALCLSILITAVIYSCASGGDEDENKRNSPVVLAAAEEIFSFRFPHFGGCYVSRSDGKTDTIYIPEEKLPPSLSEVGIRERLSKEPMSLNDPLAQEILGVMGEEQCDCSQAIISKDGELAVLLYTDGSEECFYREDIPPALWSRLKLYGPKIVKVEKGPFLAGQNRIFVLKEVEKKEWEASFLAASFHR